MARLAIFDMDGVIFEGENFWIDLHEALGTLELGIRYTKQYLRTDYSKLVEVVVAGLWKGKPASVYEHLVEARLYEPGVTATFESGEPSSSILEG